MLRRLKFSYAVYNFFQKKKLQHNLPGYKKYGLDKQYYSSISSEDFEGIDANLTEKKLQRSDFEDIDLFNSFDLEAQESILSFEQTGYCLIKNYLDHDMIDQINRTIDQLIKSKELQFKYGNKLMFAIHKSSFLYNLWADDSLIRLLSLLIHGEAKLFQSINFLKGSQQKSHSDSIHMTTFPLGGLLGVWLALEDIDLDNGPLHYYPRSHKLPYYLNKDYDNVGTKYMLGKNGYSAYEKRIQELIIEQKIEKKIFTAKKGDLFIWHANLLHGGEQHMAENRTRKSMVLHYFDLNRICFHEISQRPALMNL